MRMPLIPLLAVLALLGLEGCRGPVVCGDLETSPRATLRGLGAGDPFELSRFQVPPNARAHAVLGDGGLVEVAVDYGATFTLSGFPDFDASWKAIWGAAPSSASTQTVLGWALDGHPIELIQWKPATSDIHDQVAFPACAAKAGVVAGDAVGVLGRTDEVRSTNVPGLYGLYDGATPSSERPPASVLLFGREPAAFVAANVPGMELKRLTAEQWAARGRAAADAAKSDQTASNLRFIANQAAERKAATLSPVEEQRFAELNALVLAADADFLKAAKVTTDWKARREEIYGGEGSTACRSRTPCAFATWAARGSMSGRRSRPASPRQTEGDGGPAPGTGTFGERSWAPSPTSDRFCRG